MPGVQQAHERVPHSTVREIIHVHLHSACIWCRTLVHPVVTTTAVLFLPGLHPEPTFLSAVIVTQSSMRGVRRSISGKGQSSDKLESDSLPREQSSTSYNLVPVNSNFSLQTPGPCTPGPRTPGPRTPGPRTPGPRTPGPRTPGPCTPGPCTPGPLTLSVCLVTKCIIQFEYL